MAHDPGRENADREHHQDGTVVLHSAAVPAWVSGERVAALSVSRKVYSRKAVLATAYKFSDRCAILVDIEEDRWVLYVIAQPGGDAKPLLSNLIRELADQSLREHLEEEFGSVRTLIVAQAFSEGNLLDPGRDDSDHSVDPRGTRERR
jgi:His-Xaa-Ser system protein HxsD